ncbi:MAG: hypothetical protein LBT95_02565, partial [Treponema sp.]|nr:hypothetical protein [Treponema sp.]
KYGGTGKVSPGGTHVVFVGTADTSKFVQLEKDAVLTITKGRYTINGNITLAGAAAANAIVVEDGTLTVKSDVTGLAFADGELTGTSGSSKLVIAGSSAPTTNKILLGTYSGDDFTSAAPTVPSKGTYLWVPIDGTTPGHWKAE